MEPKKLPPLPASCRIFDPAVDLKRIHQYPSVKQASAKQVPIKQAPEYSGYSWERTDQFSNKDHIKGGKKRMRFDEQEQDAYDDVNDNYIPLNQRPINYDLTLYMSQPKPKPRPKPKRKKVGAGGFINKIYYMYKHQYDGKNIILADNNGAIVDDNDDLNSNHDAADDNDVKGKSNVKHDDVDHFNTFTANVDTSTASNVDRVARLESKAPTFKSSLLNSKFEEFECELTNTWHDLQAKFAQRFIIRKNKFYLPSAYYFAIRQDVYDQAVKDSLLNEYPMPKLEKLFIRPFEEIKSGEHLIIVHWPNFKRQRLLFIDYQNGFTTYTNEWDPKFWSKEELQNKKQADIKERNRLEQEAKKEQEIFQEYENNKYANKVANLLKGLSEDEAEIKQIELLQQRVEISYKNSKIPPKGYLCKKCKVSGHYYKNCHYYVHPNDKFKQK